MAQFQVADSSWKRLGMLVLDDEAAANIEKEWESASIIAVISRSETSPEKKLHSFMLIFEPKEPNPDSQEKQRL